MFYKRYSLTLLFLIIIVSHSSSSFSKEIKKNEQYYNHIYCDKIGGIEEFRLPNKTRIDCLTDEFAIEMDWAKKWYEGITQALYYGMQTSKKPRLVLIIKSEDDEKYYHRAANTIRHYNLPIDLVQINSKE